MLLLCRLAWIRKSWITDYLALCAAGYYVVSMPEESVHVLCQCHPVGVSTVFQSCFLHNTQQQALANISAQYLELEFKLQCKAAHRGVMRRRFYVLGQYPDSVLRSF